MNAETSNTFGRHLKKLRKSRKLTQLDLAKLLNVSQVTVANYERGERFPKKQSLFMLANYFQISIDSLVGVESTKVFPDVESEYSIDALINLLLNDTLDSAFLYTSSWQVKKQMTLAQVYEDIIVTLLMKTGDLWEQGSLLVSEEHLISAKVRELIVMHANQENKLNPVPVDSEKSWMGLCVPGEKHELALLMYSQLLRISGWTVYYLGTQVPYADLKNAIAKYRPAVLGLSITMSDNLIGLDVLTKQLRDDFPEQITIITGGQGFISQDRKKMTELVPLTNSLLL